MFKTKSNNPLYLKSLLLWFFLCIITFFSLNSTFSFPLISQPFTGNLIPSHPITSSRPFNQCFSIPKHPSSLSGIELIFATYNRENQGDLTFSFQTPNSLFPFFTFSIPATKLTSNTPYFIPIKNSPLISKLCLTLTSTNPNPSTSPSIWLSKTSIPFRLYFETTLIETLFLNPSEHSLFLSLISIFFLLSLLKFAHETILRLIS